MLQFAARRLGLILLVSVSIVYFSFLGIHLMGTGAPGETLPAFWPTARQAGGETVSFFARLVRGEMGTVPTAFGDRPLIGLLKQAYGNSMALIALAVGAAALLGVAAGLLASLARRRRNEYALLILTIAGISAPSFLIAVLLQQGGIWYTQTFGRMLVSMGGYAWDFKHLAMPLIVLSARPLAYITRATYLYLNQIMEEDYIRTAFSKGLSSSRVILAHALKNLAVPVLTAVGVSFRFSLSVLPVVEYIYAWPGIGLEILRGIGEKLPAEVAVLALAIGLTIQGIGFTLDLAYRLIDPRMKGAV